jgi:hypothetical protein
MINQFHYIALDISPNMQPEDALPRLKKGFRRVTELYFPVKKRRQESVYEYVAFREQPFADARSISDWCEIAHRIYYDPRVFTIYAEAISPTGNRGAEVLIPFLAPERRPFYWSFNCRLAGKRNFDVTVEFNERRSTHVAKITLSYPEELENQFAKHIDQAKAYWQVLTKHVGVLSDLKADYVWNAEKNVFECVFEGIDKMRFERGHYIEFDDIGNATETLEEVFVAMEKLEKIFSKYKEFFISDVTFDNAVEVFRLLLENGMNPMPYFAGKYKNGFHPDQFRNHFPKEGYWQFPMFSVRVGRTEEDDALGYLVQTPTERIWELQIPGHISQKTIDTFLSKQSFDFPVQRWDGPNNERWGLHKLRRDQ